MPTDLPIRCACGKLRGILRGASGERGNRLVCYCDDCQSFAHALGHADEILDENGGSDIFQTSPSRLEIHAGAEQLACLSLRKGGLTRWYADCCKTPIGNTLASAQVPFVGLLHNCIDHSAPGHGREEVLGPVRSRVNARFARGNRDKLEASDRTPVSMLLRFARMLIMGRLRGEHSPSPFFDAATGERSVAPRVLGAEELRAAEAR